MRIVMAMVLLAGGFLLPAQDNEKKEEDLKNPHEGKAEAVEAGRKQFLNSCSGCHGPNAEGGRGPRLLKSGVVRGSSNRQLFTLIKDGVKGSDMPPTKAPDEKIWEMVSFVKNLNAPAYEANASGNAESGGKLFHGKAGCAGCHAIAGKGGVIGPDLTNAGMSRSYANLRESLLQPSERPSEGYLGVTVTLRDGKKISGIAKNNTNYSIQVMDRQSKLYLLNKLEVSEIVFKKSSLMPEDFGKRLSKAEIDDVLAYVSRQVERVPVPGGEAGAKEQ
ncbi:MAG: c-type cytochrome [Acidobacteriia bacterium]|nr:c-type cytochrome [Terriglobia bacterium]